MASPIQFSVTSSSSAGKGGNGDGEPKEPPKTLSCDMCRQRKIKCNKREPCNQCTSSFHDCTYSEPARKKRKTAMSDRIDFLESRLKAMEAKQASSPNGPSPLDPPGSSASFHRSSQPQQPTEGTGTRMPITTNPYANIYHNVHKGAVEFQGISSDRTFIQGIYQQLGLWADDINQSRLPMAPVPGLFDTTSRPSVDVKLPSRDVARRLTDAALDGQSLYSVVHRPSFDAMLNLVYSLDEADYSIHEHRFLPLLYAVLAYGCRCVSADTETEDNSDSPIGAHYYEKSRQLQDVAACNDLISLQAFFFKILYLVVTSRIFTCYTYTSTALSIALRMGLHRSFTNPKDLISREISKRLFWAFWTLANDISTTCGLPRILSPDVVDQESPIEVNDIYIEQDKVSPGPVDEFCPVAAGNSYRKLHAIVDEVTAHIYSEKRFTQGPPGGIVTSNINPEILQGIEAKFKTWVADLPNSLTLGASFGNDQALAAQFTLSIALAHSQLYLYRPFLQYFTNSAQNSGSSQKLDLPLLATLCIHACENIIMLCEDMWKRGLLVGGNWLASRALLSSTHTLFYVVLTTSGIGPSRSIARCLALGRKVSDCLSARNSPASRWKIMMTVMIATLPSSARHVRDRLVDLEAKMPPLSLYKTEGKVPDDSYTASLGRQTLSLLGSDATQSDKLRWLPPHLFESLGLDGLQTGEALSPSWRIIPRPQPPVDGPELDLNTRYWFDENDPSDVNIPSLNMPLSNMDAGFGNMEDFLDLQSWL